MDNLIPDGLKVPLVLGAIQLPGMLMQHRENMQAQDAVARLREKDLEQRQKFMSQMAEGINAW